MAGQQRDSERTKAEILGAARALFATRDIKAVTIREIAAEAGVAHSLVNRYFGSKDEMVAEIVRREAASVGRAYSQPEAGSAEPLDRLRHSLEYAMTEERTTLQLIVRASLAGIEPESMLSGDSDPLRLMRDWIAGRQSEDAAAGRDLPDPALVSATVGAAVFAFSAMSPWLMTTVGLTPETYDARRDEIVEILVSLVAGAAGLGQAAPR